MVNFHYKPHIKILLCVDRHRKTCSSYQQTNSFKFITLKQTVTPHFIRLISCYLSLHSNVKIKKNSYETHKTVIRYIFHRCDFFSSVKIYANEFVICRLVINVFDKTYRWKMGYRAYYMLIWFDSHTFFNWNCTITFEPFNQKNKNENCRKIPLKSVDCNLLNTN